jgi:gamma-glutamyltranspeptidase
MSTVDRDRMGVTLIQSNASGWGSNLVEPNTRIFLQNRGMGFSLDPASPAVLSAGRKPPHTLSPMMVTNPDGSLNMSIGTMGGDSQPQILLQLLVRTLVHGASAACAYASRPTRPARGPKDSQNAATPSSRPPPSTTASATPTSSLSTATCWSAAPTPAPARAPPAATSPLGGV